ncbi:hypothetical protein OG874_22515 [Nocardia sp. NBC_00565]|uniref:hypothetical protein n=1 Tax=Nocardia sp. NBC_00565 TaxID=2975993 RepID=UPI002E7FE3C4|nr:hypothetical protein [Nocardia sp. NBC_00565]WUC07691.1 hypothetical protein OG874_22515 [Nocardia sp. NBC_00565]
MPEPQTLQQVLDGLGRLADDLPDGRERHLQPVKRDPMSARVHELTARAARAGYRLVRDPVSPYDWNVLDASDGERIHSAARLDQIDQWLDS